MGRATTIPSAFAVSSVGLAPAVPVAVQFAVITGLGDGLVSPSLLTWALGPLGEDPTELVLSSWRYGDADPRDGVRRQR